MRRGWGWRRRGIRCWGRRSDLPDGSWLPTGRLSVAGRSRGWLIMRSGGAVLLPGTGFVELAVAAAEAAGCGRVEELTLQAPLVLPPAARSTCRSPWPRRRTGPGGSTSTRARSPADPGQPWTLHAGGTLDAGAGRAGPGPASWPPGAGVPLPAAGAYDALADRGYAYGPAFQNLAAAWRDGPDVCAEVVLGAGTPPPPGTPSTPRCWTLPCTRCCWLPAATAGSRCRSRGPG